MIESVDGFIAGVKPPFFFYKDVTGTMAISRPFSYWSSIGWPGAGTYDNTLNGVVLDGHVAGQIPVPSGEVQLASMTAASSTSGMMQLCDRLWHNGNIANNLTLQSITSPTWPARDANGTTNGEGVVLGLEISATTGANAPTITVTYTNSDGTAGRTAGFTKATVASTLRRSVYPIELQSGDVGVRSVQSLQYGGTAWASGTAHLVAYRVLGQVNVFNASVPNEIIFTTGAGALACKTAATRSVPFLLFYPSGTTTTRTWGHVTWVTS